jgi:transcriptional regulator GlxA family with amidase domain
MKTPDKLFVRLEQLVELRRKLQARYARMPDALVAGTPESLPAEPSLDDLFLQKIYDLVEAHLSDKAFGNEQLAKEMLLSQSQLFRKLKALTGQSVAVHIRSIRLQKGKEMLQTTPMTVSEIAHKTGFTDPHYFSRTFSKEFGVSPSGMRK